MTKKVALITGGSRGLGRAMALALARDGYQVAVTGRNEQKLAETARELPVGRTFVADVTDPARTEGIIEEVTRTLGPIDVLINNAGIGGGDEGPQRLEDMDTESWWRVHETNVKGPLLYSKAVLPTMTERGHGIIINIGSYISIRPSTFATAYASSKAALARFSDCLAEEVDEHGIQVFCVSPGLVLTDMTRNLPFIRDVPESRFNQPEDIGALACRLATGKYGKLSGLFLHVNDDVDALLADYVHIREKRLYELRLHNLGGLVE